MYATQSKATGFEAVGLDGVAEAARQASAAGCPVVAIGGITLDTAPRIVAAGADAVAVIGDLIVPDPARRVRQFLDAL